MDKQERERQLERRITIAAAIVTAIGTIIQAIATLIQAFK